MRLQGTQQQRGEVSLPQSHGYVRPPISFLRYVEPIILLTEYKRCLNDTATQLTTKVIMHQIGRMQQEEPNFQYIDLFWFDPCNTDSACQLCNRFRCSRRNLVVTLSERHSNHLLASNHQSSRCPCKVISDNRERLQVCELEVLLKNAQMLSEAIDQRRYDLPNTKQLL